MIYNLDFITNYKNVPEKSVNLALLDPFFGSNTTGVQAHLTGRNFIGFESDPEMFALGKKRLEKAQNRVLEGSFDFDAC